MVNYYMILSETNPAIQNFWDLPSPVINCVKRKPQQTTNGTMHKQGATKLLKLLTLLYLLMVTFEYREN